MPNETITYKGEVYEVIEGPVGDYATYHGFLMRVRPVKKEEPTLGDKYIKMCQDFQYSPGHAEQLIFDEIDKRLKKLEGKA